MPQLEKRDHPTAVPAGPLFRPLPSGNLRETEVRGQVVEVLASWLQRNVVASVQIRKRIMASLRATATAAGRLCRCVLVEPLQLLPRVAGAPFAVARTFLSPDSGFQVALGVLKAAWSSTLGSRSIVVNGTGSVGRGPVSINASDF